MITTSSLICYLHRVAQSELDELVAQCLAADRAELETLDAADELFKLDDPRPELKGLAKLWNASAAGSRGELVAQCLAAYEEGAGGDPGLDAVYDWMRVRASRTYPPVILGAKVEDARRVAVEVYGDCFLILAEFVASWNRRHAGKELVS